MICAEYASENWPAKVFCRVSQNLHGKQSNQLIIMITDPISNFLTRLRNASGSRRNRLTMHSSNMIKAITQIMADRGFISKFEEDKTGRIAELTITLSPTRGQLSLKRISKPGQRIYRNHDEVKRVRNGLGIGIFSTSSGVITDKECREKKIGGEYICEIF